MISEDDKVAVRLTAHARHEGDFMGLPASGKEYTISETHIFHMRDGKVAEHWRDADMLGLMRQLGALPQQPK
jgi:predicted ester cyclase